MASREMGTSRWHWFYRGLAMGLLVISSLNAISFFVRTGGWGSILRRDRSSDAIGFPLEIWRNGESYGGYFVDVTALGLNAMVGLLIGSVFGALAIWQSHSLNLIVDSFHREEQQRTHLPFQFTIGTLLFATIPIAVLFAAARTGRDEVLAAIYLFGPLSLVILAMLPRQLAWEVRVIILTPMALALIGFAIWIGANLNLDFDKVLMGIFVCWVPQSAIGALFLTAILLVKEYRELGIGPPLEP